MFRPGCLHPIKGLRNTHGYYKALAWLYPLLHPLFPNQLLSLRELGKAMIHAVTRGYESPILAAKVIAKLAK